MKKLWLIVLVSLAVILSILFLFRDKATAPKPQYQPQTTSNGAQLDIGTPSARYVDYDESIIANNPGKKVLFFHAKWCPQCRQIESDILTGPLPKGWTIIKVDYDNSQDLRRKYGVTLQTTFVKVDDTGNSLGKFVAYDDPHLSAVTQNFLEK
jgi:hypothetical protein